MLNQFGTVAATLEGWYDPSGISLPPGVSHADYQLTFEPVNPLYTGDESVGPYALGQVTPSGTMPIVILRGLTAGSTTVWNETIADSAGDANRGGDGVEAVPVAVPVTGEWLARLSGYGREYLFHGCAAGVYSAHGGCGWHDSRSWINCNVYSYKRNRSAGLRTEQLLGR